MADAIPADVKRFRAGIIPLFINLYSATVLLTPAGLLAILLWRYGLARVHWSVLGKIILFTDVTFLLVSCWLVSCLFAWLFVFGVSREGVYGHSFWGTQQFIRWGDISTTRKFRMINLIWLRIYSKIDGRVVWLPLFQARPAQFRAELDQAAPAGNPIFQHLN